GSVGDGRWGKCRLAVGRHGLGKLSPRFRAKCTVSALKCRRRVMRMNDQKPAGGMLWCVVAFIVAPLFFILSVGPACWLSSRLGAMGIVSYVYRPLTWVAETSDSDTLMSMLQTYSALGSTEDAAWAFSPEDLGNAEWTSGWFSLSTGGTIVLPLRAVAPSPVS